MANQTLSKIMNFESSSCGGMNPTNASPIPSQASSQQGRSLSGPVGILWDIENCPVPCDVRPEDVAGNIRMALRVHPVISGAVTLFSAYGDFNAFPRRLREGCQRTGVKLVDVPNGRKDAADKAILVDMFLFALDNAPPSSILLISGDVDFAPALHILGQRGYTVILVIPARVGVSLALSNAGRFVWDWPSVAHGEGFVPPKSFIPREPDLAGYLMGCSIGENTDCQNEEEAIVYTGISQGEYSSRLNINQIHCFNSAVVSRDPSRGFCSIPDYGGSNMTGVPCVSSTRCQYLPSGVREAPVVDQNQAEDETSWVQPGDIQGLKGQLVRLLEMSGGSLALVRLPAEYLKKYGRPLYVAEYGAVKLVHLIKKMGSGFSVVGKGHNKVLCLRNSIDRQEKAGPSTQSHMRKDTKGKGTGEDSIDIGVYPNMGSSSDDFSDDEKIEIVDEGGTDASYECDDQLKNFRREVQELLVCFSGCVLFSSFEALYEQRHKKSIDCHSFGVDGLEELIDKVGDVVMLYEEQGSKRKFLISSYKILT